MDILTWILVGLVAGVLAGFVMKGGYGLVGDILVGIGGAVLGGWLFGKLTGDTVTGFNVVSVLIALVGACLLIALLRAIAPRGRRRP